MEVNLRVQFYMASFEAQNLLLSSRISVKAVIKSKPGKDRVVSCKKVTLKFQIVSSELELFAGILNFLLSLSG